MSATRTPIYFTDQRDRIDRAAAARGITMAELVRRAVDDYLSIATRDRKRFEPIRGIRLRALS